MAVLNRRSPYRNWRLDQSFGRGFTINRDTWQYDGLVGLWTCFGQNRGVVALRDEIRSANMTAFNTPTIESSEFGPVIHYDAASSEYQIYNDAILSAAPLTMAVWVKLDQLPTANGDEMTVFSIGKAAGVDNWYNLRADDAANFVQFTVNDGAGTVTAQSTIACTAGVWQHYCGIEITSSSRAVYLNGTNKGTDANAKVLAGMNRTRIGAFDFFGIRDETDGLIAEARLYNRALSDAEVFALFDRYTRWDLYKPTKRAFFMGPTVAIRIPRYGFTNFQIPGIV